jgi:hypothetical protein
MVGIDSVWGLAMIVRISLHLGKRFPEREIGIMQLERADPEFRDLCCDYEECIRVLQKLSRDSAPDFKRVKEYRELKLALEDEVLEFLGRPI